VSDINSVGTVTAAAAQINGSANINGNLGVGGAATVNSTLSVAQGSYMYGGATVYNGMNVASGNINVAAGSITMANGGQINNSGTQYIEAAGNLYLKPWNGNGITVVGGGGGSGQLEVTGHLQADQAIDSNNYIKAGNIASVNAGCGPSGAMGSDGSQVLFCQSGIWKALGGGFQQVNYEILVNTTAQYLGVHAYCAIGQIAGGPQGGYQQAYTDGNNNWWATNIYWTSFADPRFTVNCLNLPGAGM
jgi:hypothetical protein